MQTLCAFSTTWSSPEVNFCKFIITRLTQGEPLRGSTLIKMVRLALGAGAALLLSFSSARAAAPVATGTVMGRVFFEATGEYLRNAIVEVVGSPHSIAAGPGGEFILTDIPAGHVLLRISYTGLVSFDRSIDLRPGEIVIVHDVTLSARPYGERDSILMKQFIITSERQGQAKAIMDQKASIDARSVLDTNAYGQVAEGNVAEFLKYLPGLSIEYRESDVTFVGLRGFAPQYTAVLMDGNPIASAQSSNIIGNSPGGAAATVNARALEFDSLSLYNLDTIEVSKVPLADMPASSGAGVVNLKTKRGFDRKGRLITYDFSLVGNSILPLTLGRSGAPGNRLSRPMKPSFNLQYYDVLLNNRLGLAFSYGLSDTISAMQRVNPNWQFDTNVANNATEIPKLAPQFKDGPKAVTRTSYSLNADYKLSDSATVGFHFAYSDFDSVIYDRLVDLDQGVLTTAPTVVGGLSLPASTLFDQYWIAGSRASTYPRVVIRGGYFHKYTYTTNAAIPFDFKRGNFSLDGAVAESISANQYKQWTDGAGSAPNLQDQNSTNIFHLQLDPGSSLFTITQLAGPSFRNIENYTYQGDGSSVLGGTTPGTVFSSQDFDSKNIIDSVSTNLRYDLLHGRMSLQLRGGFAWVSSTYHQLREQPLYTYTGTSRLIYSEDKFPLLLDPYFKSPPLFYDRQRFVDYVNAHPGEFIQTEANLANALQTKLEGRIKFNEETLGSYLMTVAKIDRFDLIPGLRYETYSREGTKFKDIGNARAVALSGTTNQNSLAYVNARYGQVVTGKGDSSRFFPNLQVRYHLTPSLRLLAGYRESIVRPAPADLIPSIAAINDTASPRPTVRVTNPELKPETGRTFNLEAQYYFEPSGLLDISVFRQDFRNKVNSTGALYTAGPEGVFGDSSFAGYDVTQSTNIDAPVHLTGAEFSYRHVLAFLPAPFRGLSLAANYTILSPDDWHNFMSSTSQSSGGALKRRFGSTSISYRYKRFSMQVNSTLVIGDKIGETLRNGVVDRQNYRPRRITHDVNLSLTLYRNVQAYVFARNITNEPDDTFTVVENRVLPGSSTRYGTYWSFGVKGRF